MEDGKRVRVVLIEPEVAQGDEPTLEELRAALVAVYGTRLRCSRRDLAIAVQRHGPAGGVLPRAAGCCWQATPRTCTRPTGGQGLNIGVQDAVNLGWKLAQVVHGTLAGEPARHLSRRAAPDRRARAQESRWRKRR